VGAFGRETQAHEAALKAIHLARLEGKQPSVLAPAKGAKDHMYRARLNGFASEHQARDACSALKKKGNICVVVPPAKGGVKLASR
jgi:hypothetical protein